MVRGTASAALRRMRPEERQSPPLILRALRGYRGVRTVPTDEGELRLESWFEDVRSQTRPPFGRRGDSYPTISGTFVHEFPMTLETREGVRTLAVLTRAVFSLRPDQGQILFFGPTATADFFASQVGNATVRDPRSWGYMGLGPQQLFTIRQRASNVRGVGYQRNPDAYVHKMSYTGTNVDQNAEVRRADRAAELYRVMIEFVLSNGKRTIQLMQSGNMLGYGASPVDFEDLADVIHAIAPG